MPTEVPEKGRRSSFAFLFPRFKILSGAEKLILKLSQALVQSGHKIHIVSHQFDSTCRPLLADGVNLHVTGARLDFTSNRYVNAAFDYFRSSSLLEALPGGVDAVCCFGPALTAAPLLKKRGVAPLLYFCYEPPRFLYTDRDIIQHRMGVASLLSRPVFYVYRKRDKSLVRSVDRVLSNSEFGRKQIASVYGCDATVITHGLDPYRAGKNRHALRNQWGFGDEDLVVITVNYLHPRKRIDLFLQALQLAQKKNPRVRGVIVGDGPERQRLKQSAGNSAVFAGFIPEEEIYEYYQAADLYLHTGRLETFGLSVIEASGNRLPVVSVQEGGPMETVLDVTTGLLRPAEAQALADAVVELADNGPLRKDMGERGFEYVRSKYSWERGAGDFLSAIP